jgi:SAM-dependent methyltransferase
VSTTVERTSRGPFDGVLQIVRYNWTLYLTAIMAAVAVVALVWLLRPPPILAEILIAGAAVGVFWLLASLAVSYYIYDLSDLYHWEWIRVQLGVHPHRLVNITAGLDETSGALRRLYPDGELTILDIYDPKAMPEPSIARARLEGHALLETIPADFRSLPLLTGTVDAALVIFTAHELRERSARDAFFKDVRRVMTPDGRVLLVEHVRDAWNLAAFGPGAFHFFSRQEWLRVARTAGFHLDREIAKTAFVHAFLLRVS